MTEKILITYEVDDGYKRPQQFKVDEIEIEDYMKEDDLKELYDHLIQEDFEKRIGPKGTNEKEFVIWGMGIVNKLRNEIEEEENK